MFRVMTFNLNGIRSAARKGFFEWIIKQKIDVLCVQELKGQLTEVSPFQIPGYQFHFVCAEKKGYSGVGIYTRHTPKNVIAELGWKAADEEGRYLEINLGNLSIVSLYLPSGTAGEHRQSVKYAFLDFFAGHLKKLKSKQKEYIIAGDWNIAHKQIDLKNWRTNQKNSGFLPEERAWMDTLFGELGYVDAFRVVNQESEQYTWWSHRGRAREKNVGWRIDYQVITPGLQKAVHSANVYREPYFGDHAPLIVEYKTTI